VVIAMIGPGMGHRVHTKTERDAKLFLSEREMFRPALNRLPRSRAGWIVLVSAVLAFTVLVALSR
jgi:hypothetical protein